MLRGKTQGLLQKSETSGGSKNPGSEGEVECVIIKLTAHSNR